MKGNCHLRTGQRSVNSGVECPLGLAHPRCKEDRASFSTEYYMPKEAIAVWAHLHLRIRRDQINHLDGGCSSALQSPFWKEGLFE